MPPERCCVHAQTPLSCGRTRTWASELAAYVEAAASGEERCEARARREALATAVHCAPESPEGWWALLSEEDAAGAALTGACPRHHMPATQEVAKGLVSAAERGVAASTLSHRVPAHCPVRKRLPSQDGRGPQASLSQGRPIALRTRIARGLIGALDSDAADAAV